MMLAVWTEHIMVCLLVIGNNQNNNQQSYQKMNIFAKSHSRNETG